MSRFCRSDSSPGRDRPECVWGTNAVFSVTASQEPMRAPFPFEASAPSKYCSIADESPGVGIL